MTDLKKQYPRYEDLPENIRWITDRLEQLQALQQVATLTNEKAAADAFWQDMLKEYESKFGGNLVEDIQAFGRDYL